MLARPSGLDLQRAGKFLGIGIKFAVALRCRKLWLDDVRRQMIDHASALGREPMAYNGLDPRYAISHQPRNLPDRQLLAQMHAQDDEQ